MVHWNFNFISKNGKCPIPWFAHPYHCVMWLLSSGGCDILVHLNKIVCKIVKEYLFHLRKAYLYQPLWMTGNLYHLVSWYGMIKTVQFHHKNKTFQKWLKWWTIHSACLIVFVPNWSQNDLNLNKNCKCHIFFFVLVNSICVCLALIFDDVMRNSIAVEFSTPVKFRMIIFGWHKLPITAGERFSWASYVTHCIQFKDMMWQHDT